MRNCLFATASLAFVTSPAMAADMLSVGVGGFMQQWFGYADRSDKNGKGMAENGGFAVQSDSEIHFKGSLESDMGLKYTVHVELQGDGGEEAIDETFVRVSGEFGQIEFGSRDHAMVRMHSGISDVGIGLTSGDTQKWIPGAYLETAGHGGTAGGGNDLKLNYISPRAAGLQVGLSYAPKDGAGTTDAPAGNDDATWGAGLNFQQAFGDVNLTFSLGHRSTGRGGSDDFMVMTDEDGALTKYQYDKLKEIWDAYEMGVKNGFNQASDAYSDLVNPLADADADTDTDGLDDVAAINTQALVETHAHAVGERLGMVPTSEVMKSMDDQTYTNVGIGVGFGAFSFNVAYAAADMGTSYMVMEDDGIVIADGHTWDHDADGGTTDEVIETMENNDPSNDMPMTSKVMTAPSKDYDVLGVSVSFTDGPMSVSLGYMTHEEDAGGEREATMVSASYTLGPGVAWKSSIFSVEDTTSAVTTKDGEPTDDMMNEGTGFVTGITLSF